MLGQRQHMATIVNVELSEENQLIKSKNTHTSKIGLKKILDNLKRFFNFSLPPDHPPENQFPAIDQSCAASMVPAVSTTSTTATAPAHVPHIVYCNSPVDAPQPPCTVCGSL